MKRIYFVLTLIFVLCLSFVKVYALQFSMPTQKNQTVFGHLQKAMIDWGDNFHTIGQRYDVGFDAMVAANPNFVSSRLPIFYHVLVPSKFILPNTVHKGIVVNLAEKRLFYYDNQTQTIFTFPVAIGKAGWSTPQGDFHIIEKIKNPSWTATKSILTSLAKKGFHNVPKVIHPGPQDPLGHFAMRLSRPLYLIHGTNDPASIGTQASSGCIRLFAKNIAQLFHLVPKGTEVHIVDQPYLIGQANQELYLSVFPPLKLANSVSINKVEQALLKKGKKVPVSVNWRAVAYVVLNQNGVPTPIGTLA